MSNDRRVRVVTDSGSDIPKHLCVELGIRIVPLSLNFPNESLKDSVDISAQEYIARLQASEQLPSTAQPSVQDFAEVFQSELDAGCEVVCITISSLLSGTHNAARLAAEQVDATRIHIVDSRAATMQQGWTVIEAARAAQGGADVQEVIAAAESAIPKCFTFAVLQTLDYVYKGGRIGRVQHAFGSALGIKPIVGFAEGVLIPYERVRTWKKAVGRVIELASSKGEVLDLAVLHTDNLADAQQVERELRDRYPEANIVIDWAGPTISTYAGPGALGIMVRVA
ncbi:MAG: DegV family protein [Thermomicrobiales bacterium]|nr:DegV family protein [Thermomicrobiales bacterium]